jgi:hypothetical protein
MIRVSLAVQAERAEARGFDLTQLRLNRIRADAISEAAKRVKALPVDATKKPFITDKAVLDAVWEIAQAASEDDDSFFVVNESWTVPTGAIGFAPLDAQRGIAVAAAGNTPNRDITERPFINFAGQSLTSDYIVAVMNMNASGALQCNSSFVGAPFADTRAVGFDGTIAKDCGTSFSAPRVAWLIAAGEALRETDVASSLWAQRMARVVRDARAGGNGLAAFLLDPIKLLNLAK